MERAPDGGQAVLQLAVAVVFAALLAIGAARAGVVVLDRQQAQTAADAAALAGVDGGRAAAASFAARNGARLVSFQRSGWVVTVVVRRHDVSATASASNGP